MRFTGVAGAGVAGAGVVGAISDISVTGSGTSTDFAKGGGGKGRRSAVIEGSEGLGACGASAARGDDVTASVLTSFCSCPGKLGGAMLGGAAAKGPGFSKTLGAGKASD